MEKFYVLGYVNYSTNSRSYPKKNLICLSIGATYLQEKYPSEARGTNDIDFVVFHKKNISESELEILIVEQLQLINCQRYIKSNNPLRFRTKDGVKVHIYVQTIGDFNISATIKKRASADNSLAIEDYVFLKLLPSDREKDIGDIIFILRKNANFNWKILFSELKSQLEKFNKKYGAEITTGKILDIGKTLEYINNEYPSLVTKETMEMMKELYFFYDSQR
ncbi:MAG: hypothetical protein ACFE9L_06245 [Candidatus Hodarchaeota archaeon]